MSFSRSKGSIISAFFAISLLAGLAFGPAELAAAPKEEISHEGATLDIIVALVGITAFQDSQEIRAGLLKTEGVQKVSVDTEAPGLITYRVTYAGEAMSLIDKLSNFFPKKYDFREKRLPGGGTEVDVSRKGYSG
ncbi:MAG TPA: hypothetical protein VFX30_13950 [bacterium]|nr:hypothetical protein [bacterium]